MHRARLALLAACLVAAATDRALAAGAILLSPSCGLGGELALLLPLVAALRRKRTGRIAR